MTTTTATPPVAALKDNSKKNMNNTRPAAAASKKKGRNFHKRKQKTSDTASAKNSNNNNEKDGRSGGDDPDIDRSTPQHDGVGSVAAAASTALENADTRRPLPRPSSSTTRQMDRIDPMPSLATMDRVAKTTGATLDNTGDSIRSRASRVTPSPPRPAEKKATSSTRRNRQHDATEDGGPNTVRTTTGEGKKKNNNKKKKKQGAASACASSEVQGDESVRTAAKNKGNSSKMYTKECRYGANCKNPKCKFLHPVAKEEAGIGSDTTTTTIVDSVDDASSSAANDHVLAEGYPATCPLVPPDASTEPASNQTLAEAARGTGETKTKKKTQSNKKCKFGARCRSKNCKFRHPEREAAAVADSQAKGESQGKARGETSQPAIVASNQTEGKATLNRSTRVENVEPTVPRSSESKAAVSENDEAECGNDTDEEDLNIVHELLNEITQVVASHQVHQQQQQQQVAGVIPQQHPSGLVPQQHPMMFPVIATPLPMMANVPSPASSPTIASIQQQQQQHQAMMELQAKRAMEMEKLRALQAAASQQHQQSLSQSTQDDNSKAKYSGNNQRMIATPAEIQQKRNEAMERLQQLQKANSEIEQRKPKQKQDKRTVASAKKKNNNTKQEQVKSNGNSSSQAPQRQQAQAREKTVQQKQIGATQPGTKPTRAQKKREQQQYHREKEAATAAAAKKKKQEGPAAVAASKKKQQKEKCAQQAKLHEETERNRRQAEDDAAGAKKLQEEQEAATAAAEAERKQQQEQQLFDEEAAEQERKAKRKALKKIRQRNQRFVSALERIADAMETGRKQFALKVLVEARSTAIEQEKEEAKHRQSQTEQRSTSNSTANGTGASGESKKSKKAKRYEQFQQQRALEEQDREAFWKHERERETRHTAWIATFVTAEIVRRNNKLNQTRKWTRSELDTNPTFQLKLDAECVMAYRFLFAREVKTRFVVSGVNANMDGRLGTIRNWDESKSKFCVGLDTKKGANEQEVFLKAGQMDFANAPEPHAHKKNRDGKVHEPTTRVIISDFFGKVAMDVVISKAEVKRMAKLATDEAIEKWIAEEMASRDEEERLEREELKRMLEEEEKRRERRRQREEEEWKRQQEAYAEMKERMRREREARQQRAQKEARRRQSSGHNGNFGRNGPDFDPFSFGGGMGGMPFGGGRGGHSRHCQCRDCRLRELLFHLFMSRSGGMPFYDDDDDDGYYYYDDGDDYYDDDDDDDYYDDDDDDDGDRWDSRFYGARERFEEQKNRQAAELLGLDLETTNAREVRSTWKRLALKYHPDKYREDNGEGLTKEESQRKFQDLTNAHDRLQDRFADVM